MEENKQIKLEAFKLHSNVYFIGSEAVSVHLIDTECGLVLIDTGYPNMGELILENIKKFSNFDVYGHLDYVVRYGPNKDKEYTYEKYKDILDSILKLLIEKGKGIEINTGGVKSGLKELHPCTSIVKRYRELGGEIITIGSDAHTPEHIASHFNRAEEVLKECGFKYYTIFEKRVAEFKKL